MLASFCIFSLGRGKKEEPDPVFRFRVAEPPSSAPATRHARRAGLGSAVPAGHLLERRVTPHALAKRRP